jgi:3-oxoadipate enol-lactonase
MPRERIRNAEIRYERTGAGEPLLLIMGMSGSRLSWGEPFLEELRRDFEIVAYDHRGIGGSSPLEGEVTIAGLADDAVGLLDAVGWESAHVLGISMGGMTAQELVLRHEGRARTLTLGCTYAGGPGSRLTAHEDWQALAEAMQSGDRERALRATWELNVSEAFADHEDLYAAFREQALAARAPVRAILAQVQAVGGHDASARLGRIDVPTLVVHGTEDRMLPASNAQLIASAIPGARLELLEGIGHLFFWERPERAAELVRGHALAAHAAG